LRNLRAETNVFVASAELSEVARIHACVQLSDGQLLIAGGMIHPNSPDFRRGSGLELISLSTTAHPVIRKASANSQEPDPIPLPKCQALIMDGWSDEVGSSNKRDVRSICPN